MRQCGRWHPSERWTKITRIKHVDIPGELTAGIRHEPEGKPEIVVYVEVNDLEGSVEKAAALGGSIRIPPTQHGNLRFALITDPEGNPVGLTEQLVEE